MKKKIFASLVVLTSLMFSQGVYANNEEALIQELNQQLAQELSKDDLLAATQDYVLEKVERPQARRSALFAHIFDSMVQKATMAKADTVSKTLAS